MSIKSELKRLERRLKEWWAGLAGRVQTETRKVETKVESTVAEVTGTMAPTELPNPSLASCWEGQNAGTRHMNELSPHFTEGQVSDRLDWAVNRGCNTVHWFVTNQGDGEGAGYSIYGTGTPTPGKVDAGSVERMKRRIALARKKGLVVVLWLLADDSSKWNAVLLANPKAYAEDLKHCGLLDDAAAVVLGLEMNEYVKDRATAKALADAVRGVYGGKIGTHHTSGDATFSGLGDLLFWQTGTGLDEAAIKRSVERAKQHGKPVIAFELARNPQRKLAQAALDVGAVGVGNW